MDYCWITVGWFPIVALFSLWALPQDCEFKTDAGIMICSGQTSPVLSFALCFLLLEDSLFEGYKENENLSLKRFMETWGLLAVCQKTFTA